MKKNIHIEFTVIPTPGINWGSCNKVNISIPKKKFKNIEQVKSLWFEKTNNVARKIIKCKEKIIS